MSEVNGTEPGMPSRHQDECVECKNAKLIRALSEKLEGIGLKSRLVVYSGGSHYDDHVEEVVVMNPAAPQRGEMRVGDDGSVTWEYFGSLDDSGIGEVIEQITNALSATGRRM